MTGLISGIASTLIEWLLFAKDGAFSAVDRFILSTKDNGAVTFLLTNILINALDKGISFIVALFLTFVLPKKLQIELKNSIWMQRPLDDEERKSVTSLSQGLTKSVRKRVALMVTGAAVALVTIIGWSWIRSYYEYIKDDRTEIALNTARLAANLIDQGAVGEAIQYGETAAGYDETYETLYNIWQNSVGVEYLYVVQIRDDMCYFAFDVDTGDSEDASTYSPGDAVEVEDAFQPYLSELHAGEEIEPMETNDTWGWLITAYYPILDENGACTGYVGADVSVAYLADYTVGFLIRTVLIMAGLIVVLLGCAAWVSGAYLVFPLSSLGMRLKSFTETIGNQEGMDENVKKLRALDIHTEDEMESLYLTICTMAANQAEQVRTLNRFSDSTTKMQDGLIITMADLVENRDSDTGAHIQKTAAYVKIIVEGLKKHGYYAEKITPKFMSDVVRSAPLHDVGKINIPDAVLNKPGKLTDEEYEIMKTHTTAGKKIMEKAIGTVEGENYLKEARNMAGYHHERWDGKGYPEKLHGEVIPLSARIMAVADVFDALTSPRVYKPAFPLEKALSIIQEGAGTQFDPKCVEVFMEALPEVKVVLKKYNPNANV